MPHYRFDNDGYKNEARSGLNERLQRQEMGDEAYDRMIAKNDDGAFKKFGIVFIIALAVIAFAAVWIGW
jgi:hypothetical protein